MLSPVSRLAYTLMVFYVLLSNSLPTKATPAPVPTTPVPKMTTTTFSTPTATLSPLCKAYDTDTIKSALMATANLVKPFKTTLSRQKLPQQEIFEHELNTKYDKTIYSYMELPESYALSTITCEDRGLFHFEPTRYCHNTLAKIKELSQEHKDYGGTDIWVNPKITSSGQHRYGGSDQAIPDVWGTGTLRKSNLADIFDVQSPGCYVIKVPDEIRPDSTFTFQKKDCYSEALTLCEGPITEGYELDTILRSVALDELIAFENADDIFQQVFNGLKRSPRCFLPAETTPSPVAPFTFREP
jgi:hypothetical protein